jgi:single-stranded-DNA-specific exonuclease
MSERPIQDRPLDTALANALPGDLHPVLRRVYAARGFSPEDLDLRLSRLLPVGELNGVKPAAELLAKLRDRDARVLVVGDFDADGACASALVVTCLSALNFRHVDFLVPDRFEFGYGLSAPLVEHACTAYAPDAIITVDNGISSLDGVARAAESGIEVIVTDHHLPGPELPDASVIVNPNNPGQTFLSKNLAGVGVAFYVMAALAQRLAAEGQVEAARSRSAVSACLDLVALGTVADLVPLDRNNRILVDEGLRRMRAGRTRPGIRALFSIAGRNMANATAQDLGFAIGPRINAAGRLDDMSVGIRCLLAETEEEAMHHAGALDSLNRDRQRLQNEMHEDAVRHLEGVNTATTESAVCLYDPSWHQGVVGLVASRIKDRAHRPVVAFAGDADGILKGSARSVTGLNIRDALALVDAGQPGLIRRFGGHAMAAGLEIDAGRLSGFKSAFVQSVDRLMEGVTTDERILTDGSLDADELGLELAQLIRAGGPWGQACPEPLFVNRFEVLEKRIVGQKHLKLMLRHPRGGAVIEAIAFNRLELPGGGRNCAFVYRLDVNEYRGRRSKQLVVEHVQSE